MMTKPLKQVALVLACCVKLAHGDRSIKVRHQSSVHNSIDATIRKGILDERSLELETVNFNEHDFNDGFVTENIFEGEHLDENRTSLQPQITNLSCPDIGSSKRLLDMTLAPKGEMIIPFTYEVETNSTTMEDAKILTMNQLGSLFVSAVLKDHCTDMDSSSLEIDIGMFEVTKASSAPQDYAIKECPPTNQKSVSCISFQGFVTVVFIMTGDNISPGDIKKKVQSTLEDAMEEEKYPEIINKLLNGTGVEVTSVKYTEGLLGNQSGAVAIPSEEQSTETRFSNITRGGNFLIAIFVLTFVLFVLALFMLAIGFKLKGTSKKGVLRSIRPVPEENKFKGDDKPIAYEHIGGKQSQIDAHTCLSPSCKVCNTRSFIKNNYVVIEGEKPLDVIPEIQVYDEELSSQFVKVDFKRAAHLEDLFKVSDKYLGKPQKETRRNPNEESASVKTSQIANSSRNKDYCHDRSIELVFKP